MSQQLRGFSECSAKRILGQARKSENRVEKAGRRDYHWKLMERIDRRAIERRESDRRVIERRIAERFTIPLKGKATFPVAGAQDQREIKVKNISAFGIYFIVGLRPDVSDKVTLHLPVKASGGPFEATATVVRVEEVSDNTFGIAGKFEGIPDFGYDRSSDFLL